MRPGRGINELPGDPDTVARFANAALEDIANAKLAANLFDIDGFALVGEARIPGDHEQRL